jgi:hypothetical protein
MSHRHFCDVAGHYWECEGTAQRSFAGGMEPSVCICLEHHVPMEEGDHSKCPIELLSCPEHRDERLRKMGAANTNNQLKTGGNVESSMFKDKDGNPIVGFCLWCDQDFYSIEEVAAHNADDMKACSVYQELRDDHCMPPVLQVALENAGLLDNEKANEEN